MAEVKNAEESLRIWKTAEIEEFLNSEQKADETFKAAESIYREAISSFRDLDRTWKSQLEDEQEMTDIIQKRDRYGVKYDELIREVDGNGKKLLDAGGDYRTAEMISEAIDEVTIDLESSEFKVSSE